jgi:hypothetical protein
MTRQRHERISLIGAVATGVAVGLALVLAGCGVAGTTQEATSTSGYAGAPDAAGRSSLQVSPEIAKDAPSAVAPAPGSVGVDASKIPAADRLVIRNKTLRVEVAAVTAAIDKIRAMAKRDGADITEMQVATSSDELVYRPMAEGDAASQNSVALQAYVTVRVPAEKYAAFVDEAAKLGRVLWQGENTSDVTQQHVDLSARLTNLRAQEARLREFFAKAKNVTEMLQIEAELSRVRGDIESMAAQVAYLERQASMATVNIELAEPKALVRPTGTDWGVAKAFTDSIRAFVGTLNVFIVMLGPALAVGIFIVLPVFLVVRLVLKRSRKRALAAATPDAPSSSTGA